MKAVLGQIGMGGGALGGGRCGGALFDRQVGSLWFQMPAGCDCYHSARTHGVKQAFKDQIVT